MKFSDLDLLSVGHTLQLAGAVYAGEGRILVVPFPEEKIGATGSLMEAPGRPPIWFQDDGGHLEAHVLEMDLDEWSVFLRQSDLLEVEAFREAPDGKIRKAVLRKSQRQIEEGVRWAVFRRDGFRCRYCAREDVPMTVDHLVLWEEGGPSVEENLVTACRKCNKTRGKTQYSAWLEHPYYARVSASLTEEDRTLNACLAGTLDMIERSPKRSR